MTAWMRCFNYTTAFYRRVDAKHCCGGNLAGLAAQETCIDGLETNFASRTQANASAGKIVLFAHTFFFQKKFFPV